MLLFLVFFVGLYKDGELEFDWFLFDEVVL